MIRFLFVISLWLVLGLAGAAYGNAPRVMVFGDSLSAAYGINPQDGWVALLEKRLRAENAAAQVINASISGETSRGGLARIATDLKRHQPTLVLLQLGANDGLRGLPLSETRQNLQRMVAAISAAKAQAIVVGLQLPPNYGIDYAREFRELFPALAKQNKLPLVPFLLEGIAEKREQFLPDGLHPTASAQPRLLDNVWPVVAQSIKKRS